MIVKLMEEIGREETEILIRYGRMSQTVERLQELLQAADYKVKCRAQEGDIWITASDIYYAESVDKRTWVYCDRAVYRSELCLHQLQEELSASGFVQVSKACILNLHMLESIRPLLNSRMEATLVNGERIGVTRKFIPAIRRRLEGEKDG